MARITVTNSYRSAANIVQDPETGWTEFQCACGVTDTDRGDFADTINAAEVHVDHQCPLRLSWTEANPT
jgi:hypothetical protein